MNKNLLKIVIISALLGGVFGSFVAAETTQANILDDILKIFRPTETQEQGITAPEVELYKPVIDYEEAVIAAVRRAEPSVVSIVVTKDLPVIERCPSDPFGDLPPGLREFFRPPSGFEFYEPCEKGTETREVGGGTGFVVSEDGLILTNKHVVADEAADYTVLTNDGEKHDATVLARDPVLDLAIVKVDINGLTPAALGDSDSVQLGQTAIAIGNSLGDLRNTVSVGVVSGLSRTITARGPAGAETIQGLIQTDAAINPGNSGGPLLNLRGEVIGINTALAQGAQSVGFAIPVNLAKRDIDSVKATGEIKVPYLGVRYITEEEGARLRGGNDGKAVMPDSPAERAGLQVEDVIQEVNGEKLSLEKPLGFVLQKYGIGETVTLKVRRGEQVLDLQARLDERPNL